LSRFQSTHPRGVRRSNDNINWSDVYSGFNPRTREGCDASKIRMPSSAVCFNPRTREGCDYETQTVNTFTNLFQSTHPRGVRRIKIPSGGGLAFVSIHAPARGATIARLPVIVCLHVSIHAPARGATRSLSIASRHLICFNPRTREGCDVGGKLHFFSHRGFNPRTREGCDPRVTLNSLATSVFQSTHPRGVRPQTEALPMGHLQFQSTHPRGVRLTISGPGQDVTMFQSTHPRGVRLTSSFFFWNPFSRFQSTHPRGVRRLADPLTLRMFTFQSTHPRGVRHF